MICIISSVTFILLSFAFNNYSFFFAKTVLNIPVNIINSIIIPIPTKNDTPM